MTPEQIIIERIDRILTHERADRLFTIMEKLADMPEDEVKEALDTALDIVDPLDSGPREFANAAKVAEGRAELAAKRATA